MTTESHFRDEAEALAIALEIGAVEVDEVIDWADAQIAVQEAPHWALCEVATSRGKRARDVVAELRQLPGGADPRGVQSLLVQLMAHKLKGDGARSHASAFSLYLYELAHANQIDDPELREIGWWAWDALDLAVEGCIAETPAQVIERMRDVLNRVALSAMQQGCAWTGTWVPR